MDVSPHFPSLPFHFTSTTRLLKTHGQISQPIKVSSSFPKYIGSTKCRNMYHPSNQKSFLFIPSSSHVLSSKRVRAAPPSAPTPLSIALSGGVRHWMVIMERPQQHQEILSKSLAMDYYVSTLQRVLRREEDAQSRIYDASCDTHFGFCCNIDEETSCALARLPGVLLVRPDVDVGSAEKDYSHRKLGGSSLLFPVGSSKHWLVRMDKPFVGDVTKVQMVDFYVKMLTKVLRNDKDAQMCIYHVSWQSNFGFCCILDEECAQELAAVPGVLSVSPDQNFGSDIKDYEGDSLSKSIHSTSSSATTVAAEIQTKKLFITGLSFYTSEETLRAAFEPFGEIVGVNIIMDKISKRSKGYAFIEYTAEEAASAALKEMNGKVINGWMIVVDMAKRKPKYNR